MSTLFIHIIFYIKMVLHKVLYTHFIIYEFIYYIFGEKSIPGYILKNKVLEKGISNESDLIAVDDELVINKYKNKIYKDDKKFSSAFVQCAICTTIAQELHLSLFLVHKTYPPEEKVSINVIDQMFKTFCSENFQNFDLREFSAIKTLSQVSPDTTHVTSYLDGLWGLKMKEMCLNFMDVYGSDYIYDLWFAEAKENPNFQMTDTLCRYSLLRYCNNINEDITPTSTTYQFPFNNTNTLFTKYFN